MLVLQDPLRPTTSDGQHAPPGAQHAVPQGIEQPASPLPPPLLLEPLLPPLLVELPPLAPLLPLLLAPLSCFGAASGPESGPSPASMGAPLLPAPLLLGPPLPAPPLDVPLDESLDPPLPPLVVVAPLPLPPSTPPVLAPASDVSVPSPDKLKGLPPHSGIATAMASDPRARASFRRMTWFLQGTLGNLQRERCSSRAGGPRIVMQAAKITSRQEHRHRGAPRRPSSTGRFHRSERGIAHA